MGKGDNKFQHGHKYKRSAETLKTFQDLNDNKVGQPDDHHHGPQNLHHLHDHSSYALSENDYPVYKGYGGYGGYGGDYYATQSYKGGYGYGLGAKAFSPYDRHGTGDAFNYLIESSKHHGSPHHNLH